MNLKTLCNIARIFHNVDFNEFINNEVFDYAGFILKLGQYRVTELLSISHEKDIKKAIDSIISEYNYELGTLKDNKEGKNGGQLLSIYEVLISYDLALSKMNKDPEKYTVLDAKIFIETANRNGLQASISNVRSQLKTNEKAILDFEIENIEGDYETELEKIIDHYIDKIRNPE